MRSPQGLPGPSPVYSSFVPDPLRRCYDTPSEAPLVRKSPWLVGATLLIFQGVDAAAQNRASSAQPAPFHVAEATIRDIHVALTSGKITCRELVSAYLRRIDAYNKSGPGLNAVQTVNPHALEEAGQLDALGKARGPLGPLYCIPVVVKDQVETKDMPTTYGSAVFRDFVPDKDATIVKRLKAAGAIILAKTTMGEFASGYLSSAAGVIRNAYDPRRHASGSSGGTASAVTANLATSVSGRTRPARFVVPQQLAAWLD